ncbi:MAG: NAD(P)-binding domain-containing protein [Planctomycetota bacterium]|nr:NAD(P)-binding domain-containing protein [Planctomycetota bacterium]
MSEHVYDLLVVGAGPTGIALGAEAVKHGLDVVLVDKGALTQAMLDFPTFMTFFTTRDLMEIANIPFSIPHDKPTRQDALAYFRAVADHYKDPAGAPRGSAGREEARRPVRSPHAQGRADPGAQGARGDARHRLLQQPD